MCQWINDTLKKADDDGTWAKAFEPTLGHVRRGHPGAAGAGPLQADHPTVAGAGPPHAARPARDRPREETP